MAVVHSIDSIEVGDCARAAVLRASLVAAIAGSDSVDGKGHTAADWVPRRGDIRPLITPTSITFR